MNLAPWYYRKLLGNNLLIEQPKFYEIQLIDKRAQFEAIVYLKKNLKPSWCNQSKIYTNCDGSGTSEYKNVAVYKAISEALERLAFYELAETDEVKYSFDINPTTTGMAAFPYFNCGPARENAINEATERWAIHEFNRKKLPIKLHKCNLNNLLHYEIVTPFEKTKVSLLVMKYNDQYMYGFSGGNNLIHSFEKALIELDRNIRVITKFNKNYNEKNLTSISDERLIYFSTEIGFQYFDELIKNASKKIINDNPKVLCDKQLRGHWDQYTKVWRYLLEDSYISNHSNNTFFMF